MRHQERNVSEFDEIITYPPSAAPSGEKQVMSCVQAFTAALGFAMSAGWDWLPSMHTLWLRDYIEAVSMPTPFGFFGTLSGSIFFKMVMLLALCPVMDWGSDQFGTCRQFGKQSDWPCVTGCYEKF